MLATLLFGSDKSNVWQIMLSALLLYAVVVAFIRVSGKRSTSQMNNFDWIVTVAIGSLLGSGIILHDIGVIDVTIAIGALLGLQYLLTWSVIRSEAVAEVVKASPRMLVYQGEILTSALRDERISRREVMAALRERGVEYLDGVAAVILETDATFSVIRKSDATGRESTITALDGVPTSSTG